MGKKIKKHLTRKKLQPKKQLVVLIVLDGLGIYDDALGNASLKAKMPFLDTIWSKGFSTTLGASGTYVGLPSNEQGNSEVGHLSLGTGRVLTQSLTRINQTLQNDTFAQLPPLKQAMAEVKKRGSKLHLMGILSAGGVHGHIKHLFALLDICKANKVDPYIHAILDGRDTGFTDGYYYVSKLVQKMKDLGIGKLASMSGRFYSMDRDTRWKRTQRAYNCMVGANEREVKDPFQVLQMAYKSGENDQIFKPTTFVDSHGQPVGPIRDNDVVIFYNYREDRARQITRIFMDVAFDKVERINYPENLFFVTMGGYEEDLGTHPLFPTPIVTNVLSDVIAQYKMQQLHITETEKFAHITYFFNGGREKARAGETFFKIPSPNVFDYAKTPGMSARAITDQVLYELDRKEENKYNFMLLNYANPDMLGHTGNLEMTIKANQMVDGMLKEVVSKTIEKDGLAIVVADHGNCETMINRLTRKVDRAHTNNKIPMIAVYKYNQVTRATSDTIIKWGTGPQARMTGILADIPTTILPVLDLSTPTDMSGVNLFSMLGDTKS